MQVRVCNDKGLWNYFVNASPYSLPDHFWEHADVHVIVYERDKVVLIPFTKRRFMGFNILLSYGLRRSGGPFPASTIHDLSWATRIVPRVINSLIQDYGYNAINITLKTYVNVYYRLVLRELLRYYRRKNYMKLLRYMLRARVLDVENKSYEEIWWKHYNKKARNAVRKFMKNKGEVRRLGNPLVYLKDILLCNLSSPKRQGKPLPPTYTNPFLVYKGLKQIARYMEDKKAQVYGAFLDNKLVGYSYVIYHNGYAYISRFLIHAHYTRYCIGEGLLDGIIRDLIKQKIRKIQYGYWSPRSAPGIDHFLRQFGFREGIEQALIICSESRGIGYLALKILLDMRRSWENPSKPPLMTKSYGNYILRSILRKAYESFLI